MNFPTPDFSWVEKSGFEKFTVEKSGVEKFLFSLGLKSSWLKRPGLNGLGLKLGVENSGVEMFFNRMILPRAVEGLLGTPSLIGVLGMFMILFLHTKYQIAKYVGILFMINTLRWLLCKMARINTIT